MLYTNFVALCFYTTGVIADGSFTLWEDGFTTCDLELEPLTFIYKLNLHYLEIYRMCKDLYIRYIVSSNLK